MELEDRARALEDRHEIERLKYEYARRIDDDEFDGVVELFAPDAIYALEGWGTHEGREEIAAFVETTLADAFEYTAHVMHHPMIDLDGDTARGEWYLEIHYALADGAAGWRQGRYFDEYERVDGEWRFSSVSHTIFARQRFEYEHVEDERYGEIIEYGDPR
ncbi:MAG: nuclear transport factor 2 family protein [Halobacteriota archaeon]|uniref:nuclear transport factor 2 family protein n=1 Tax=Natronomonas sp. TaxID=2184060 RepID=UPI003976BC2C